VYAVRATRHGWGLDADGPSAERERAEAVAATAGRSLDALADLSAA
jgi:hypothetical protein